MGVVAEPPDRRGAVMDRRELPRGGRRSEDRTYERAQKIDCPYCGHFDSLVRDGWTESGKAFLRTRQCVKCQRKYETAEFVHRLRKSQDIAS